ncbi:MAG: hypothetical protein P8J89_09825 [Phycisphaerales bacterium]|nr:hypothetical protein [Phycisphaerales bacterium]
MDHISTAPEQDQFQCSHGRQETLDQLLSGQGGGVIETIGLQDDQIHFKGHLSPDGDVVDKDHHGFGSRIVLRAHQAALEHPGFKGPGSPIIPEPVIEYT